MKNRSVRFLIIMANLFLIYGLGKDLYSQQMTDYNKQVFPLDNALNMSVDSLPVHPNSDVYINSIGRNKSLHPDFGDSWDDDGTLRPIGIPYNVVGSSQPLRTITWTAYGDESDPGPWPIPSNPYIEGVFDWNDPTEGDRHMLILDSVANILYETGGAYGNSNGTIWEGGCGAIFNLNNNNLRTDTWTSADAAGLPIFPLLIRYDEVEKALAGDGLFHHAIRFTTDTTRRDYIWPARHYASSYTAEKWPPMGLRFRLKADFDISGYSPRIQVILRSMKKYGIILADNGSDWFFQGTHDSRWDGNEIEELKNLHGYDFEAVDISGWMNRQGFDINKATVPPAAPANPISERALYDFRFHVYPNPFSDHTTLSFTIKEPGYYTLKIYDFTGREVTTLVNKIIPVGEYSVEWNGTNPFGKQICQGVYFYVLTAESGLSQTKLLIKN
jgi:hypothetical protein